MTPCPGLYWYCGCYLPVNNEFSRQKYQKCYHPVSYSTGNAGMGQIHRFHSSTKAPQNSHFTAEGLVLKAPMRRGRRFPTLLNFNKRKSSEEGTLSQVIHTSTPALTLGSVLTERETSGRLWPAHTQLEAQVDHRTQCVFLRMACRRATPT